MFDGQKAIEAVQKIMDAEPMAYQIPVDPQALFDRVTELCQRCRAKSEEWRKLADQSWEVSVSWAYEQCIEDLDDLVHEVMQPSTPDSNPERLPNVHPSEVIRDCAPEGENRMSGWIGVDLDCTLAYYPTADPDGIGAPVPRMVDRVKAWLAEGIEVRIVTARVAVMGEHSFAALSAVAEQREAIEAWCERHIGQKLQVTAQKDYGMVALYDDRAVQVERNTGRLYPHLVAQLLAEPT